MARNLMPGKGFYLINYQGFSGLEFLDQNLMHVPDIYPVNY